MPRTSASIVARHGHIVLHLSHSSEPGHTLGDISRHSGPQELDGDFIGVLAKASREIIEAASATLAVTGSLRDVSYHLRGVSGADRSSMGALSRSLFSSTRLMLPRADRKYRGTTTLSVFQGPSGTVKVGRAHAGAVRCMCCNSNPRASRTSSGSYETIGIYDSEALQ